jgi:Ca-activated chloride channel homolog
MPTNPALKRNPVSTSRCVIALYCLVVLSGMILHQEPSLSQSRQDAPYTVSICVDAVVLHATVSNRKGLPVSELIDKDFQIYEDGIPQQIECFSHEDIPVTVGLVVDNSGTMGPKQSEVITAALAFARSSNPKDQMFVVHFNENVSFGLPANMPFTDKMDQLENALSRITANGRTAIYDALAAALHHLDQGNRDKKVLIVISDGGDNASKHKLDDILSMAGRSDAIIYTIGIYDVNDPDRNIHALMQLAKATGGESFLPDSIGKVISICKQIARDIRSQYSITYLPTNKKQDGKYRVIQVKAATPKRGHLLVRTRTGYYAPMSPQPLPATEQPHEDPN